MNPNELPVVLFVDHEDRMLTTFLEDLACQHGGRENKRFGDHYRFEKEIVALSPDAADDRQQLDVTAATMAEHHARVDYPVLILADLYLFHSVDDYKSGPRLAEALRSAFPQVPVWVYTKDTWKDGSVHFCSTCAIDGILYLGNIKRQADNLWNLFESSRQLQSKAASACLESLFGTPAWFQIEWEEPSSPGFAFGLKAATEALAYQMFRGSRDIGRLRLRQISPGFSGTQLVKVTCFDRDENPLTNEWVMKIAEHAEELQKLRDELEGYRKVADRIPHDFRPELYRVGSAEPCQIIDGWWGCFAMSFEGDYSPLIDVFNDVTPESVYSRVFRECLSGLYANPHAAAKHEIPSGRALELARNGLEKDGRFAALVEEYHPGFSLERQSIVPLAEELRAKMAGDDGFPGQSYRYVHGDLNCRNIMVAGAVTPTTFRLIDFPKVATTEDPLAATDFVKAEAELLFLIMDRRSGQEIAPSRVAEWIPIVLLAAQALQFDAPNIVDPHLARICRCIQAIRGAYAELVGVDESDWLQYRLVLLDTVLRYLSYDDVAPVKRACAAIYASFLISSIA